MLAEACIWTEGSLTNALEQPARRAASSLWFVVSQSTCKQTHLRLRFCWGAATGLSKLLGRQAACMCELPAAQQ